MNISQSMLCCLLSKLCFETSFEVCWEFLSDLLILTEHAVFISHFVSKNIILQKLISQIIKFKIFYKSYQDMKMKYFLIICFNNVIIIYNLFKNIKLFNIRLNEIIKKNFTDMIKKLSNSYWIWNCNYIMNNHTDYKKNIFRILDSDQN